MSTPNSKWEFNDIFGKFVDDSRMSLNELAQHSGVSAGTLKNWKDGTSRPNKSRWGDIVRVAAAIGLDRSDTDLLLRSAGLPSLDECQALVRSNEQKLAKIDIERLQKAIDKILSTKVSFGISSIGSHASYRTPLQRPQRAEYFQGRESELTSIIDNLHPGRVITLCGSGGIGKTALAIEAVWRLAPGDQPPNHFPDGIIYHSFYNQSQVANAIEHIAYSFGEEIRPTPVSAVKRALGGRRALLLLDGADRADDLDSLLDICNDCGVLITSRRRDNSKDIRIDIAPLPVHNAVTLLFAWGGVRADNEKAVMSICELVGRLPLALRLVGRYLAHTDETANDYLTWLQESPLAALDQGQRQLDSVPVLLAHCVAQVSKAAQQALSIVGMLALAPFTWEAISVGQNLNAIEVRKSLGELVNYGLLMRIRPQENYEVTHNLIHTYAKAKLMYEPTAPPQLMNYFTHMAETHKIDPAKINMIRSHVRALLPLCSRQEAWHQIVALADGKLEAYLDLLGYWEDRVVVLEAGLTAAHTLQNLKKEAEFLNNLGCTYRNIGQMEQAVNCHLQAISTSLAIGNRSGEGANLGNLGRVFEEIGQVKQAIDYFHQSLSIARELGELHNEGANLGNLGGAYQKLGQFKQAITFYKEAITISREIDNKRALGAWLGGIGIVYHSIGEVEEAVEYHEQALKIARELVDRRLEINQLTNLGVAYSDLGQIDPAIDSYMQAITLSKDIGDRRRECDLLGKLGSLAYRHVDLLGQAIFFYQQALTIASEIRDRQMEVQWLSELGLVYRRLGQSKQAIDYLQQALAVSKETGNRDREAIVLGNLGLVFLDMKMEMEATKYFFLTLAIDRETGNRASEAQSLGNLGLAFAKMGAVDQAEFTWRQSLKIFEDLNSPNAITVRRYLASLRMND